MKSLELPKYSRFRCEAVCPTAKSGPKLGHATMIPHIAANLQKKWLKKRIESKSCNDPIKLQIMTGP